MVEFEQVSRYFGPVRAVEDVSFRLQAGQVIGLVGPNGAGKTTTIRMMTGYLPPSRGRIRIDGKPMEDHPEAMRRRMGYMPEHTPLYPEMRVTEFLDFRGLLMGMPRRPRQLRIEWVVERCGLAPVRKRLISAISRGNRQRVGLAQALLHDPEVLVLDEPTAGLDPVQIQEVRRLLDELRGRKTILISSHILPELQRTVDRVLVISRGRLAADGSMEELARLGQSQIRAELTLRGSLAAVKAAAEKNNLTWLDQRQDDQTLTVAVMSNDEQAVSHWVKQCLGEGMTLVEMKRRQLSLEEVFTRLTRQNAASGISDHAETSRQSDRPEDDSRAAPSAVAPADPASVSAANAEPAASKKQQAGPRSEGGERC